MGDKPLCQLTANPWSLLPITDGEDSFVWNRNECARHNIQIVLVLQLREFDEYWLRLHCGAQFPYIPFVECIIRPFLDERLDPREGDPAPQGGIIFEGDRRSLIESH